MLWHGQPQKRQGKSATHQTETADCQSHVMTRPHRVRHKSENEGQSVRRLGFGWVVVAIQLAVGQIR